MDSRLMFTNLTSLFHMFINCKLFSHDRFVCTLISRGETFKNNLNDIKRPIQAIFQNENNPTNKTQQQNHQTNQAGHNQLQQQTQHSQSAQSLKLKPQLQPQKSMDYTSPMSAQPASMPPYNLPPHTPLQQQKSFSNDPYNAPYSVPTPCKSSSTNVFSQEDGGQQQMTRNTSFNENNTTRTATNSQQIRFRTSVQSSRSKLQELKPMSKMALFVMHLPVPQSMQFQHERNQRFVVLYGFGCKKYKIIFLCSFVFQLEL